MFFISSLYYKTLIKLKQHKNVTMFKRFFKKINKELGGVNNYTQSKLNNWINKWSVFGQKPLKLGFKTFFKFIDNINLVPDDIARNYIEPILTPEEYQPFYNDKNSFSIFLDSNWMPKTYLRSINGFLYDSNYKPAYNENINKYFNDVDRVVVKPSKEMGGKGIELFKRKGNDFFNDNNNLLTVEYLNEIYGKNYLIQECITQSKYMSQFNTSSVNTLRIAAYRNITNGKIEILGAFLRIGGTGSFVDNASSGGACVNIDTEGKLGNYIIDLYGNKKSSYNGIDFSKNEFIIPNWDKVKDFVAEIAYRLPHMSLFANDIYLDIEDNPKVIEVNTQKFSYTIYQYFGNPVFDKYTDDIIEFCKNNTSKISPKIILKYN